MIKRVVLMLLVVVMSLFAVTALAEDNKYEDNFTYYYDDSTRTLTISGIGEMYDYTNSNAIR